jgi:hypothetical protein
MRFHLNSTAMSAVVLGSALAFGAVQARPAQADCKDLPSHAALKSALIAANAAVDLTLNNEMWGTIVAEDGTVCAVAHTGDDNLQSQWLASRVISAQKANTANSLSLGQNNGGANAGLALSTAICGRRSSPAAACSDCSTPIRSTLPWLTKDRPATSASRTIRWSES